MLDRFLQYTEKENLFRFEDKILLTLSGGIDSMVMLDLFLRARLNIAAAHVNFQLRGEDSEQDEAFVREICREQSIEIYSTRFNTTEYVKEQGISVQMAARRLRYQWFEDIRKEHRYDYIATAHNRDDHIETTLINLVRGTGIRGLTGINNKSGHIIRPLLFLSRKEITEYANQNHITYREDISNLKTTYTRNKIRHEVLPVLRQINPRFDDTIMENMSRLREVETIYEHNINQVKSELMNTQKGATRISIEGLKKLHPVRTCLFEILKDFGFSNQITDDVLDSLSATPGKQFFSSSHRLLRDRDELIITEYRQQEDKKYYIEKDTAEINEPVALTFSEMAIKPPFEIPSDKNVACLDMEKLIFPLILRRWKPGDYFKPLGMQDMKKISDFLIDNKISRIEKENTWMLVSNTQVVWIIGKRIDDRYKITGTTKRAFLIRLKTKV